MGDDFIYGAFDPTDPSHLATIINVLIEPELIADQFLLSIPEFALHVLGGGSIQSYIMKKLAGDPDTVSYADATGAVEVNLGLTLDLSELADFVPHSDGADGHDTFIGIDHVIGSKFDDVLRGNLFDNILKGGEGDDKLYGGLGSDTLVGGKGDDLLDGGDSLIGDGNILGDRDIASYADAGEGVRADLRIDGAQDTRLWNIVSPVNELVGGLDEGAEYQVELIDANQFRLKSRVGDAIDTKLVPPGGVHRFKAVEGTAGFYFSPSTIGSIDFTEHTLMLTNHGFSNGQVVLYDANGNDVIGGLTDGRRYVVDKVSDDAIRLNQVEGNGVILSPTIQSGIHGFSKGETTKSLLPAMSGVIDYDNHVLTISGHGFNSGDTITYQANGNRAIAGLTDAQDYRVERVDDNRFRLKQVEGNGVTLSPTSPSGTHEFSKGEITKSLLPATPGVIDYVDYVFTISEHGFNDGDTITYLASGNSAIGGLTDGQEYLVEWVDDNRFRLSDLGDDVLFSILSPAGSHSFDKSGSSKFFTPSDSGAIDYADRIIHRVGHGSAKVTRSPIGPMETR